MNLLLTLMFDKYKIKYIWKFEWILDVINSTLLLWNKLYYENLGLVLICVNGAWVPPWRAPKSRGETKLKVSQSQVAESKLGSTLPASNSRKG
jgi:hypothetical protein